MNSIPSTLIPGNLGYEKTSQGFVFAISFTCRNGRCLIAPYACFYYADIKPSLEEAAVIYSFGIIRIKGRNVKTLCDLIHRHQLSAVWCSKSVGDEIESTDGADIVFKERDDDDF